jgi:spore germination protein YaaH
MPNYKIKKGDTLSAIAKKEGTTVSELMKLNPTIKDKNMIMSGANLNLPYGMEKLESNVKSATTKQAVARMNQTSTGTKQAVARMNQTSTGIKAMAAQGAAMVANKKNELDKGKSMIANKKDKAVTKMIKQSAERKNIGRPTITRDANKEFIKSMGIGTKAKKVKGREGSSMQTSYGRFVKNPNAKVKK